MPGVPGKGGAIPKRESQRRRVNKPSVPVTKAASTPTGSPPLPGEGHSDLARRFWESLGRSGQSQFYEDSDWLAAEVLVGAIDAFVKKPTAMMLGMIQSGMSTLLVTEGDRRRLRVELEKPVAPEGEFDAAITRIDSFQRSG